MKRITSRSIRSPAAHVGASVLLLAVIAVAYFSRAYGDTLVQRQLLMSDNRTNATAIYVLSFTIPASETLGSIKLEFCANDPLFDDPCTVPSGFDIAAASLSAQSGATGFSVDTGAGDAHTLVLTRTAAPAGPVAVSYTLQNVVNPSDAGAFFGRLQTFATTDASGSENDHGGLAMSINSGIQVTATVPPYLLFCSGVTISGFDCDTASGDYINFGNFTAAGTSSAQSQLLLATNAQNGYVLSVSGSTMTSGNNIIAALATHDVSRPGTAQFGINLVANSAPSVGADPTGSGSAAVTAGYSQSDFFKFVSGDALASVGSSDEYRKFTVSYVVNVPAAQAPGVYVATLTYTGLANF